MSAQPVDVVDRDEPPPGEDYLGRILDNLVAAGILRFTPTAPPAPTVEPEPEPEPEQVEEESDTRFTLTYREGGREITVDLDEVPDEELPERVRRWRPAQQYAAVEDIRFMAAQGETLTGVAERLTKLRGKPINAESVERFLHRYGAHELVWQLKANGQGEPTPGSPDWYLARTIGNCRPGLSPEDAEAARRRWLKGPQDSGISYGAAISATARSPFARAHHGQAVRGRRL